MNRKEIYKYIMDNGKVSDNVIARDISAKHPEYDTKGELAFLVDNGYIIHEHGLFRINPNKRFE